MSEDFKICTVCNRELLLENFNNCKKTKNNIIGKTSKCKDCHLSIRREMDKDNNTRKCPDCNTEITYTSAISFKRATKKNSVCKECRDKNHSVTYNILLNYKDDIIHKYTQENYSVLQLMNFYKIPNRPGISKILRNNGIKTKRKHISRYGIKKYSGIKEISKTYWNSVVESARTRCLDFEITKEYLISIIHKQEYKCNLTGLPINLPTTHKEARNASIDRIDSYQGYVNGNIQFLDKDVNKIKLQFSNIEFYEICKKVVFNNGFQVRNNPNIDKINERFWSTITRRAKGRGIELSITNKDITELFNNQDSRCALTGDILILPMSYYDCEHGNKTASLDRIDSDGPYSLNNVRWVHKKINVSKWNFTDDYYKSICRLVYNYMKPKFEPDNTFS